MEYYEIDKLIEDTATLINKAGENLIILKNEISKNKPVNNLDRPLEFIAEMNNLETM